MTVSHHDDCLHAGWPTMPCDCGGIPTSSNTGETPQEPEWCADCDHYGDTGHTCCRRCEQGDWEYTTDIEFPIGADEFCVYVGAGDHCDCHSCQRFDTEHERRNTEHYWRGRIAAENRARTPIGTLNREDDRKPERDAFARAIADSEAFMWLMVGANHPEAHLRTLRESYNHYAGVLDGGYGRWSQRQRPLTDEERAALDQRIRDITSLNRVHGDTQNP